MEQRRGKKDNNYVQFIQKLIENFSARFDDFLIGKELLLFIENPFLVVDTTEFSVKAKDMFESVDAAKIQLELIEFQESVVVKKTIL